MMRAQGKVAVAAPPSPLYVSPEQSLLTDSIFVDSQYDLPIVLGSHDEHGWCHSTVGDSGCSLSLFVRRCRCCCCCCY
jgi:hypothetical protein